MTERHGPKLAHLQGCGRRRRPARACSATAVRTRARWRPGPEPGPPVRGLQGSPNPAPCSAAALTTVPGLRRRFCWKSIGVSGWPQISATALQPQSEIGLEILLDGGPLDGPGRSGRASWRRRGCPRGRPGSTGGRPSWARLALAIFEWIEAWYNPTRRHSSIQMLSPIDFELQRKAAAAA